MLKEKLEQIKQRLPQWKLDPTKFIFSVRGLKPQEIKEEYQELLETARSQGDYKDIKLYMFEPFTKGKHITRQQAEVCYSIRDAISGVKSWKISIRSGHGIGKSTIIAMIIIWFLFCYKDAQVPTTAPTAPQLQDILWKELASWINRLPDFMKIQFERTSSYIRIKEKSETWFARARTGKKENPEALAGVHSDNVLLLADEASGVADEVFDSSKGSLTGLFKLFMLISNPTRLSGYFYDTHHKLKEQRQSLHFNSEESPIVDKGFVDTIVEEHGIDSDEYRIRVQGKFPSEEGVDDKGYIPLLQESDLRFIQDTGFIGYPKMGVDPAGEGKDETIRVGRDSSITKILATEKESNEKGVARKTLTLMTSIGVGGNDVFLDNFGVGANVGVEIGIAGERINPVNVGDKADDQSRFINKRAECFWRLREWVIKGGSLVGELHQWKDLLMIRYRRELNGKIKIMSKQDMRKLFGKSPDRPDALSLTFWQEDDFRDYDSFDQPNWSDSL